MLNLRKINSQEEIVPKDYDVVYLNAQELKVSLCENTIKNDSLYWKIADNILYIRATPQDGYQERKLYEDATQAKNGWYLAPNKGQITKAVIEEVIYPTSCARFFDGYSGMTEIENFEYIQITKSCTSLWTMFQYCYALQSVDVTNWDVRNVKYMPSLFGFCENLISIGDLSKWNVKNTTDIAQLIYDCSKLTSVGDLSNWNVSNVTDMKGIFQNCYNLVSVGDLSNWDVSNVTNMSFIFANSKDGNKQMSLTSVGDLSNWDVSSATNMRGMFQLCNNLVSVGDLSNWNTSACTDMSYMFNGNDTPMALTSVGDLSNWDTSKVTTTHSMFSQCENIKTFGDLSNWKMGNVTDMKYMFNSCDSLTSVGDLKSWDLSKVTDAMGSFWACTSLTSISLPKSVVIGDYFFATCTNLQSITFDGTISEWTNKSKGQGWKASVPSTCVVHCTDGDTTI